jgi:hypothetical protein
MRYIMNTQSFKIFSFATDSDLYVAVPEEYLSVINEAKSEFGSLDEVSSDKTVRGIFLKYNAITQFVLDENTPQVDITINQLREKKCNMIFKSRRNIYG